jgi:hypothetical protein
MNCLEIQRQLADSPGYSNLSRSVQKHLDRCTECQGAYPTQPELRGLLFEALPEIEPDPRLLATLRVRMAQEMERPRGLFQLDFLPSFSFAAGVAVLFAVLVLPLLWIKSPAQQRGSAPATMAQVERLPAQLELAGPFNNADPLLVADPLNSLHRAYRPQIQPGSIVHVIYPFQSKEKTESQRTVVHY